jgi:photosystem II stability/assembly factor-like uncharacterized protein
MRISRFTRVLAVAVSATLVATTSYAQAPPALAQAQVQAAEKFALVVLPDTQYASEYWPEVFRAQMQWVDNQQTAKNIKYVLHVGDVIDNSDQLAQWNNSKSAMGLPTDDVPYIIGPGNHDLDPGTASTTRGTVRYNTHYPRSTFTALPSFRETYPETKNDNAYHTFTAGGGDWLVLAMKYAPSDAEIAWANQVVSGHPGHNAILVTHAYQNGTAKDTNGNRLWNNLVSKHANFRFTFSGHYRNAGVITQRGVNGNTVHQIQADYQDSTSRDPNSYLRLLTYNPATDSLDVKTYSPFLNRYMTDAKNEFVLGGINPIRSRRAEHVTGRQLDFNNDRRADIFTTNTRWVYSDDGRSSWINLADSTAPLDTLRFGDFNGDGRTDVFTVSGTEWRYSDAGQSSWIHLLNSTVPFANLRFGDFNGDGRTDVFTVSGTQWNYSSAGQTSWINLVNSTVPFANLRFGDFNGDGRTDVFTVSGTQWMYSSAGQSSWTNLANSTVPFANLRFGDFNGDGRTDIFTVTGTQWAYSSAGQSSWINLVSSTVPFANLRFGDFNGDGRTDVFTVSGTQWMYSSAGQTSWTNLVNSTVPFANLRLGNPTG